MIRAGVLRTEELARLLVGAADAEMIGGAVTPLRLPLDVHAQFPDESIARMVRYPAGIRLRMHTAALRIHVDARVEQFVRAADLPVARPGPWLATTGSGVGRRIIGRAEVVSVDHLVQSDDGSLESLNSDPHPVVLTLEDDPPGEGRVVEVWLPHNARVDLRWIGADAPILPAASPSEPRWIHYGSSISQCNEAVDPLSSWPALAAHALAVDLVSFAFAGNAMLDPFVARAISECPVDVITLKVGINIVNAASLTARTLGPALHGFLERVREGHPSTPIVVISAISCPMHENVPGPTVRSGDGLLTGTVSAPPREGELTLDHTRSLVEEVVRVRAVSDSELHYLDGRELFGADDVAHLRDGLHPDQGGFDVMASRFVEVIRTRPDLARAFALDDGDA